MSIELIFNDVDPKSGRCRDFEAIATRLNGQWLVVTAQTGTNYEGYAEAVKAGIELTDDNGVTHCVGWQNIQTVNV